MIKILRFNAIGGSTYSLIAILEIYRRGKLRRSISLGHMTFESDVSYGDAHSTLMRNIIPDVNYWTEEYASEF